MPVTHAQHELSFCPSWAIFTLGTLVSLPWSGWQLLIPLTRRATAVGLYRKHIWEKWTYSSDSLTPVGTHTQSCWPHCSSCPSAAGCFCKAQHPLKRLLNRLGKLSPGAHFVCSFFMYICLEIFREKDFLTEGRDLYQATFLYLFLKEVSPKTGKWESKYSAFQQPGTC